MKDKMVSLLVMLGGAALYATAFIGGSYLAKSLSGEDEERIRHDKALEKYQRDVEAWQKEERTYHDYFGIHCFQRDV